MKKLLLLCFALIFMQMTFGQLTGTKTIPGDYATIQAAITALNAQGVGSGGVTFNVAAGYTETITAVISLTATGTAANPVIFQKSGAGTNPLITAYVGTNTPGSAITDGIWNFIGSDYVTINGIDLTDPNATNPATMEYGYAMYKADAGNGCQYNTIKNCVVTLSRENNASGSGPSVEGSKAINVVNATAIAQTTDLTPTTAGGTNSYNIFYSNTLQNCNYGIVLIGYAAVTPFTLADYGNDIGGSSLSTGNNILNYGGGTGATNPSAGIRTLAQYNLNVSYNTVNNNNGSGVNHVSALRGIYLNTATSATATISNNTISVSSGATTSQVSVIENVSGSTAAGNTININNNTIQNCGWTTATSGTFYGIYNSASPANLNINSNSFTNCTRAGSGTTSFIYNAGAAVNQTINNNTFNSLTVNTTGTIYLIYCSSSLIAGGTQTINGNSIVSSFNKTGAGGTLNFIYTNASSPAGVIENWSNNNFSNITVIGAATIAGIQNTDGGAPTKTLSGNTVSNITGGTSAITGINFNYGTADIYNNTISNISGGGAITAITAGGSSATLQNVYANNINTLSTTGASTVTGIISAAAGTSAISKVYKNNIYNLQANNASGIVYGLSVTAGTSVYLYNNFISDLKAPSTSNVDGVRGISITSATASSTIGVYYNTIYLNASSTGANFGSTGIYHTYSATASTAALDMRNNIIVNNSTPSGTGFTVAFRRSASTSLVNYTTTSNNNCLYAGTPSASRLIYYDGTNSDQTLAAFKSRVSPREASSVSENPSFVNVATTPYNLHIQTTIPSQCESGGTIVSTPVNVIVDFDGNSRYPNAGYPDNAGSPATAPDIGADEFGGLLLDLTAPNIAFTALANTSGTGARTLTTTITDATGVPTTGIGKPVLYWKINSSSWSSATANWVSGSTYTFTFGAGTILGDVVSYYIVAQDIVTPTPNIGANPSAGASGYTYNPPACSTPPTTPYSYTIVGALSGVYPVGTGQVYPTLTAAIADLSMKEVIAPVTFELWDATYSASETFPLIITAYAGMNPANPVTFRPKAGVTATVTGAPTSGILVIYGADYIIINGSNSGGTDRSLTFENTNIAANTYVLGIFHNGVKGAQNNTIKNCVVKAGGKVNNTWAIILNAAGGDFDNTVIQNNQLLNAMIGMQFVGVTASITNNGLVTQNIFGSSDDALTLGNTGMNVSNVDGLVISGNTFQNFKTGTNPKGINIGTNSLNATITGNTITGIRYTGTGGYGGKGIDVNTGSLTSNMTISNNAISQLLGDGWSSMSSDAICGIRLLGSTGGINVYFNSVNLTGTLNRSGATADVSAAFYAASTIVGLDVRNNIFLNSLENTTGVATAYSIYSDAPAGSYTTINYNDYFVSGPEGVLGYLGSQRTTLAAWQAATLQDANSRNLDPLFASATDLHPTNIALDNLGFYLTSVTTDYSGVSRTNPPDIGAYEFGTNPVVVTLAATSVDCGGGTLNGTINANGLTVDSFFDYGLTTSYGSSIAGTPATITGSTPTAISAALSMPSSTTYHFRARGVTTGGVNVYGNDLTLTTSASGAPVATTLTATNIGNNSATLNGTVNALCYSTTVTFEYGLNESYGFTATADQSPVNGGFVTPVSANIGSLSINTLYHFRVVASSSGGTTYGVDLTFTTGAAPPIVTTNPASNIGNFAARLNGTVDANNQNSTVTFEWGLTVSYSFTIAGIPGTVTGNTPTAVYADLSSLNYNTTYHFRCVGQNAAGTTYGADQMFTTLCPVPETAGAITGPTSVCQATSGHVYTVPPITYAYAGYVWTIPPGGTITGGANTNSITVSYNSSAVSGNVTVYGTSVCGNGTPSSLAVTVNPLPVPVITGPDVACITSSYVYSTESGMTGYVWTVSAGGQIMAGAGTDSVTVIWNSSGAQYVTATYISEFDCPAAAPTTLNVTVGNLTTPTIVGSNLMCENSGLHIYTTQTGYSNYVWTVTSGGAIVNGQGTYQIEVNWFGAGAQTVSVNYANTYGCSAASPATFGVTVMAYPGAAGSITGTPELCAGTQGVSYSVDPIPNAVDYNWTVPAGATIVHGANTNSILVDFALNAVTGDITVAGENICGSGPSSPTYQVTVNPIPTTPVVTVDLDYLLHSSAPAGNQWVYEGIMIAGAIDQDYQATEEGFYWTIVTLNDCSSDESNHVQVLFVGLDDLDAGNFAIYPIPNDGRFKVSIVIPGEETFSINVYNDLGVKVYEMKDFHVNGKAQQTIDLLNPSKGIYTVVFKGGNQTVIRKVLVTK
jgi:hypothetical protein